MIQGHMTGIPGSALLAAVRIARSVSNMRAAAELKIDYENSRLTLPLT